MSWYNFIWIVEWDRAFPASVHDRYVHPKLIYCTVLITLTGCWLANFMSIITPDWEQHWFEIWWLEILIRNMMIRNKSVLIHINRDFLYLKSDLVLISFPMEKLVQSEPLLHLRWLPPVSPNGIIESYELEVCHSVGTCLRHLVNNSTLHFTMHQTLLENIAFKASINSWNIFECIVSLWVMKLMRPY